ncbi:PREDICTED: uncharacterized protein LOC109166975 [Ipomoea nil]|uniref:uncharacterized protein LOC109166975 n=1 Tax=Ipomoea nil TaxID=35883 RepID=UPI000901A99E|nr:PREDICTED: uncharacterized protein LOC109166975 [Ipomoea nil]
MNTGTNSAGIGNTSPNQNTASQGPNLRGDEVNDPIYLHVTENPNLILVSPPLTELNYASWSRSMKIALQVKNKFGLVDGSVPCPEQSDSRFATWTRCNKIVCPWILRSVNSTIAETVLYYEKAEDIWIKLRDRYSQTDPHRIAELQNEIYKNTQGNNSINEYFIKCNALWEQMKAMRPLPVCECNPRCSCKLLSKIQKEKEDDQVIRFLEGLNDEFESIKSGVLIMDPIPTMEKVLNMALKVERKINGSLNQRNTEVVQSNAVQNTQGQSTEDSGTVAFSASNNKKKFGNNGGKNVAKCTYCNMSGHTVEKCFKKHGYPPGWIPGYKSRNRQSQDAQNNAVNQIGDIGLSAEQFQRLVSLLHGQNQEKPASSNAAITMNNYEKKSGSNEGMFISDPHINNVISSSAIWILDSGATDHITCSLDYFERYHRVCGVSVKLPNGGIVSVTHIGDIRLQLNLVLNNVLFIPSFTFNIISASKLTKQGACKIIMNTDSCNIQGPFGMMDGFAEQRNGLYVITDPPKRKNYQIDEMMKCNGVFCIYGIIG